MLLQQGGSSRVLSARVAVQHDLLSRPWPYVDSLENDQESEAVMDLKTPPPIGPCGHKNCEICKQWTAYPQSHFGNWTIKPVTKCGIAGVVRNNQLPSTIHVVDVLEDGQFKNGKMAEVTSENKRQFWNDVLQSKASAYAKLMLSHHKGLIQPSARPQYTCTCAVRGQHVRSCPANARG
jgi:hypothetical protein